MLLSGLTLQSSAKRLGVFFIPQGFLPHRPEAHFLFSNVLLKQLPFADRVKSHDQVRQLRLALLRGRPRGPSAGEGSPPQKPLPARLVAPRPVRPSLPGHAHRRANSPGSRSGTLGPPFREQYPSSGAKARANSGATVRAQVPRGCSLRIGREWGGLDADLRIARQLRDPARPAASKLLRVRVPICQETGTDSETSGKRRLRPRSRQKPRGGRGTGLRGERATTAPRPRPSGGRGRRAPPTWRPPSPPPPGQPPRPPQRSRLAPPNRLPQRPLPLSGQLVQTNGIARAVRTLANG